MYIKFYASGGCLLSNLWVIMNSEGRRWELSRPVSLFCLVWIRKAQKLPEAIVTAQNLLKLALWGMKDTGYSNEIRTRISCV